MHSLATITPGFTEVKSSVGKDIEDKFFNKIPTNIGVWPEALAAVSILFPFSKTIWLLTYAETSDNAGTILFSVKVHSSKV